TAADHFILARWLFEQKSYDLARTEAQTAKTMNPQNTDAGLLIQTINSQQAMERAHPNTGTGTTGTGTVVTPATTNPAVTTGTKGRRLLTADQIQTIKQNELKDTD